MQSGNQQQPNTQQNAVTGTSHIGNRHNPDKKNAEHLLEAVRNNERKTIKAQIINAQPGKGNGVDKEW